MIMNEYHSSFTESLKCLSRKSYDNKCVFCGSKPMIRQNHVHHVYNNKEHDLTIKTKLSYILPLCSTCHGFTKIIDIESWIPVFIWFIEVKCKGRYLINSILSPPIEFVPIIDDLIGVNSITINGMAIELSDRVKDCICMRKEMIDNEKYNNFHIFTPQNYLEIVDDYKIGGLKFNANLR